MTTAAASLADIAHLDVRPLCDCDCHDEPTPRARWWAAGHGCGDMLRCGRCMRAALDTFRIDHHITCARCSEIRNTPQDYFGEVKAI